MIYEIDTDVPPPPPGRGRTLYPWEELEPGDSFVVHVPRDEDPIVVQRRAFQAGARWCSRNRPDCTVRTSQEGSSRWVRVWLVEAA